MFGLSSSKKKLELLLKLAATPHTLEINYDRKSAESELLEVYPDLNYIIMSEFDTKSVNQDFEPDKSYQLRLKIIRDFYIYEYTFKSKYVDKSQYHGQRAHLFTIPKDIHSAKKEFTITPAEHDKVSLEFELKKIRQFRKVQSIDRKAIRFTASLNYAKGEYGKIIYDIDLKLPYSRQRISGILKHEGKSEYSFEEYIGSEEIYGAIREYAIRYFLNKSTLQLSVGKDNLIARPAPKIKKRGNLRILVVDDKPAVTRILKDILTTRNGVVVETVNDSRQAIKSLRKFKPNLVLLDVHMPHIDGIEIAKQMQDNPETIAIPVIFLSSTTDLEIEAEARELGFSNFMSKPVDRERLFEFVDRILLLNQIADVILSRPILVYSSETEFRKEITRILIGLGHTVFAFSTSDELMRSSNTAQGGIVIVKAEAGMLLSEVNIIKSCEQFKEMYKIVVPGSSMDIELVKALRDDKIIIAELGISAENLAFRLKAMVESC
ncbi:MAG: response regulator [Candidatus Cloacimonetes bacterium]|nr:response regulator [Candidatus Cloacimonadota bacterium]